MRLALLLGLAALAACQSTSTPLIHQQERFEPASAFSRVFPASPAATCEAARRALLSQGYMTRVASRDELEGRKKFQYDPNTHLEIEFHVVCARNTAGRGSIAFVSAVQDRYALKKSATNATVGVGAFGSVSVPFGSSDDAMVKVGSETITASDFYLRFFGLVAHHLVDEDEATK
jgi:hypothetical protein